MWLVSTWVPGLRPFEKVSTASGPCILSIIQSFRASSPEDAYGIAQRIMSETTKNKPFVDVVIKAQVHAGGRGKGTFK